MFSRNLAGISMKILELGEKKSASITGSLKNPLLLNRNPPVQVLCILGRIFRNMRSTDDLRRARSRTPRGSIELPGYPEVGTTLIRRYLHSVRALDLVMAPQSWSVWSRICSKSIRSTPNTVRTRDQGSDLG